MTNVQPLTINPTPAPPSPKIANKGAALPQSDTIMADIEAEEAVLGAILIGGNDTFQESREVISASDFWQLRHQWLYEAMQALVDDDIDIENVTVRTKLKAMGHFEESGGDGFITYLINGTPSHYNVKSRALIVHNMATRRAMLKLADNIVRLANDHETPIASVLDETVSLTLELAGERLQDTGEVTQREAVNAYLDKISDGRDGITNGTFSTGLPDLDAKLGGWHLGHSSVIGAPTGFGKSMFMLQQAINVAKQGIPVWYVTVEMTPTELIERQIATLTGISTILQNRPAQLGNGEFNALVDAAPTIADLPITYSEVSSVAQLIAMATRQIRQHGIQMVIVDYIQLLEPERGANGQNREQEVARVSRRLTQLARKYNVHVMAATQLNDEWQARESKAIAHNAHVVITIRPPKVNNKYPTDVSGSQAGVRWLVIDKARGGDGGIVKVYVDPARYLFSSYAEDE